MPMIRECIVTTLSEEGKVHIAPLGLIATKLDGDGLSGEPLDWGVAADAPADDKTRLKAAGHTLTAKKQRENS